MDHHRSNTNCTLVFIGVLLLICVPTLHAQQELYRVERIPFTGELLNFKGKSILQDHEGFMWFGSQSGLYRYDGKEFKVFSHNPDDPRTIPMDNIIGLSIDSENQLWVGTEWGLARYDTYTEQFDRSPFDNICRTSMHDDGRGNIWLGGFCGALSRYEIASGIMSETIACDFFNRTQGQRIRDLFLDRNRSMWILGDDNSLYTMDQKTKSLKQIDNVPCHLIRLFEDSSGRLWCTSLCGLFVYDRHNEKFERQLAQTDSPDQLNEHIVVSITEAQGGHLWIRTTGGIYKFNQDLKLKYYLNTLDKFDPSNYETSHLVSMYEDNSGTIWFFDRSGINKLV